MQIMNNIQAVIQLCSGIFLLIIFCFILVNMVKTHRNQGSKTETVDQKFWKAYAQDIEYWEDEETRDLWSMEKGNIRLLANSDPARDQLVEFCILGFMFEMAVFLILRAVNRFITDNPILRMVQFTIAAMFFVSLGILLINDGIFKLRMSMNDNHKDLIRKLRGEVIAITKNGPKKYRIILKYTYDQTLWYYHRDTHNYSEKACPKMGDKLELTVSPELLKALTPEEQKDGKRKILWGIGLIILSIIFVLPYKLSAFI